MKVLVCGGRDYADTANLKVALDLFHKDTSRITMIIHGGARGADRLAGAWADSMGIHSAEVRALWDSHGRSSGPRRNYAMLSLLPDYCIAFPGGSGTGDMKKQCIKFKIPVWEPFVA